ncbi:MAG: methyltransferase domain-containing protein [Planctomycetota bacterium]
MIRLRNSRTRWAALAAAVTTTLFGCQPQARHDYVLHGSGPERYQQVLVPALFEPWAADLLTRAAIEPGNRVLDVATGTGVVAGKAATLVGSAGSVDAVDLNPAMLQVARATHRNTQPSIRWRQGNAQDLPYADASFDVVCCQQGLQFFDDRERAIREMARVLAPGGRLAISVWRGPEHNPYAREFARAVEHSLGRAAGDEARSPFAFDEPEALAAALRAAALHDVEVESVALTTHEADLRRFVLNDLMSYPATSSAIATWSEPRKEALIQEIVTAMEPWHHDGEWVIPWQANVAMAARPR